MSLSAFRRQRGITLIEILLVATIVAAGVVGVFLFANKASVSAAVESEQAQVDRIVKTVESAFALQPNFAALGSNGAAYLKEHAPQSGLNFATDSTGATVLQTRLGGGKGTVALSSDTVRFRSGGASAASNNGFTLAYSGLTPAECVGLINATLPRSSFVKIGEKRHLSIYDPIVAENGKLLVDPGKLVNSCKDGNSHAPDQAPVVYLSFAPSRAAASSAPPSASPLPSCAPTRETQLTGCPAGQVGSITQERHGTCTGPGNTMVYTAWADTENTCLPAGTTPPDESPDPTPEACGLIKHTRTQACPAGQPGHIVEEREIDTCRGTTSAWTGVLDSCQEPPVATCTPSTREVSVACPAGQGGNIIQSISTTCSSPIAIPVDSAPIDVSNSCTAACVAEGNCCSPEREGPVTTTDPCPAGTYGATGAEQERYRGCLNATTQGPWGPWQTLSSSGSCTACPTPPPETQTDWVNRERACPPGQTGKITYQAEQVRTQSVSYACPAGTTSLPAPTYGSWTAWTDTGNTRNEVDTCTPEPISSCASEPPVYVNLGQVGHSLKRHYADPPTPVPGYFFSLPDTTPAHAPAWVKSAIGSLRSNVAGQYSPAVHGPPPFGWESSGVPGSYALAATNTGAGLGMCLDPATVGTLSYYYSYLVLPDGVGFFEGGNVLAHTWSGQTAACMSACDAEAFYDNWPPAPDCATAYNTALTYGRVTNDDDMLGNGLPTPGEPLLKASAVEITSTGSGCSATLETTRFPTNVHWSTSFGYEGGQMIHWVKTN